ncbi:MAG: TauD/TfdA family dioxygenase [bacterium]|nr:TauD/TfdA family dioxygenase [bacterium]
MSAFEISPLDHIGAEIVGLDIQAMTDEVKRDLYATWLEYGVLLFREAASDPETHVKLAKVFGELEIHPVKSLLVPGNDELIFLGGHGKNSGGARVMDGDVRIGQVYWHQDTAYTPDICRGSMLRMIEPSKRAGGTTWADTAKAYEALPKDLAERIATLETLQCYTDMPRRTWGMPGHELRYATPEEGPQSEVEVPDFPHVAHPMVVTHPESGKRALLLSPLGYLTILGLPEDEADDLFETIVAHTTRPEFCYEHSWAENDVVLWDNRRTLHTAEGFGVDDNRMIQRATLAGPQPTGRLFEGEAATA